MKKIVQLIIYLTFAIGIIFSIIENDNDTENVIKSK